MLVPIPICPNALSVDFLSFGFSQFIQPFFQALIQDVLIEHLLFAGTLLAMGHVDEQDKCQWTRKSSLRFIFQEEVGWVPSVGGNDSDINNANLHECQEVNKTG